ncbi:glycosylhydrolase-like jelly roll fold domain-containing protein [Paenibacillus tarimensis]
MLEQLRSRFVRPPAEFSPIPFWFWNDALTKEELIRQIHDFHAKEVEGFVLHPRIGIPDSMPYLSDEFMDLVEAAVEEAARLNMRVILYDEGMYPSGSACGGVVRRNPAYASRGLRMIEQRADGPVEWNVPLASGDRIVSVQAICKLGGPAYRPESVVLLKHHEGRVDFTPPDEETWSLAAFIDTCSDGHIRGIHYGQDDGEPGAPRSADLLNPDAVRTFIELTHERYEARIGRHFGKTVIAMFTDEPDLMGRGHHKGLVPWTSDFIDDFLAGGNREEELAALWLDAGSMTATIRKKYRTSVRNRMEQVYYKQLHDWCGKRGIALTGHPAGSQDIGMLKYFHIPGQDIVWRYIAPEDGKGLTGLHSTMGKCSADAARHRARRRNLNECFGVCGKEGGWSLSADNIKWYLDWLFVRGVNLICPHAFYYSIEGKRLHERAPDVGPNNIWWSEYGRFSRYIKRMSWMMTDSINTANVALLCQGDRLSWRMAKPLFENQIEFNYLEEELLQDACELSEGMLTIAKQTYTVVLVDEGAALEPQTWSRLKLFAQQGGVIMELREEAADGSPEIGQFRFDSPEELAGALQECMVGTYLLEPAAHAIRVSHLIKDGVHLYVIVNEGEEAYKGRLYVPLQGKTELWHPWTGTTTPASVLRSGDGLGIELQIVRRESLVIVLDPREAAKEIAIPGRRLEKTVDIAKPWSIEGRPPLDNLVSWTEWEGMSHFSGMLAYEAEFEMEHAGPFTDIVLDLGEAHEMARLFLNGEEIGVQMWRPYRFSVIGQIRNGMNRLRVEVTNTLANRYDKMSLPSGLIGPVRIELYK